MIQFTHTEIEGFQNRGKETQEMVNWLLQETETLREHELVIPKTGRATWQLYYYCPDCSVRLEFDIDSPKAYRCPLCHQYLQGEPYEGAWWRWLNTFNYTNTYYLSLLYLLTNDRQYGERAKEVILTYAAYYPDYEVHGDIPYNNPGRANSQTLDEAIFLRYFAFSYDLIEDLLSTDEKATIQNNLFRIGADFLRENRMDHLHNHEVDVDAAMAVLGIILSDEELIHHALYGKYGLYDQLEKGMLKDGFWFECSSCYHFFALMNFFMFERFALHTKWSNIQHPNYRKMILFACKLLKSNYRLPMLNDCQIYQGNPDAYEVFEFAYCQMKETELLAVLQHKYKSAPRRGIEAFFYGMEALPAEPVEAAMADYHNEDGSGLTVLHRRNDQYLLLKHGPYGGEHDHYDKLEFSYAYDGKSVSTDLGTTGYGAHLHYDYFKNTVSHNTIVLDEENQAPACGQVRKFKNGNSMSSIDAQVTWSSDYQGPDSFIIKQWSDEVYEGASFRRRMVFCDDFIVDVETVSCPKSRVIDSSLHFSGLLAEGMRPETEIRERKARLGTKKPYSHLTDCVVFGADNESHLVFKSEDIVTDLFCMPFHGSLIHAKGPGNPSNFMIPYVIERTEGTKACFAHVLSSRNEQEPVKVLTVEFTSSMKTLHVTVKTVSGCREFDFDME